ncbi:uncharacterized protein L969DRAFT_94980 [Mixia osmundae IAM 14324]|uniref:Uncharacterized protein n=1 Tax=Mixia osmundae (strain CBS 9802 / IAM 14324 / JCM 22182 / KY 12970) TaxID=764103 RepID=G7E146_MIXOS|nr:uncharacterized protein L969DRAFT_94980 [Mixia osmundae IAM 14324]KEI38804.1 hypothetical protein L969DRAFT_94980 [Mixia osmundae IAM 14324]GAA96556.1 hypothetical protein E5Q_03225 [Mixia osmundae IAM 14324]
MSASFVVTSLRQDEEHWILKVCKESASQTPAKRSSAESHIRRCTVYLVGLFFVNVESKTIIQLGKSSARMYCGEHSESHAQRNCDMRALGYPQGQATTAQQVADPDEADIDATECSSRTRMQWSQNGDVSALTLRIVPTCFTKCPTPHHPDIAHVGFLSDSLQPANILIYNRLGSDGWQQEIFSAEYDVFAQTAEFDSDDYPYELRCMTAAEAIDSQRDPITSCYLSDIGRPSPLVQCQGDQPEFADFFIQGQVA